MSARSRPEPAAITDDIVIPFSLERSDVRGRLVRLGPLITDIVARHDYPGAVSLLLGETVALTALLGTSLKFSGRFILQAKTDGPVDLLVADFATPGTMRAYAHFDRDRVEASEAATGPSALLGHGNLAMTIDQGPQTERYQGVVPLDGGTLSDAAHIYFRQSEQIPTQVYLGAGEIALPVGGSLEQTWRAGGIMIQNLPDEGGSGRRGDDDSWNHATHLLATVAYDELLDPTLAPERLLYRLFHEDGVRAAPARPLASGCRCSLEQIRNLLHSFPPEEIAEMVEDGTISVTCEFCSSIYRFKPEEFSG